MVLNINGIIKEHHQAMIDKGFYDCPECGGEGSLSEIDGMKCCPCESCKGSGLNPNKNIGESLMLIVSELGEALEAHRKGDFADWKRFTETYHMLKASGEAESGASQDAFKMVIKDTLEDEIADKFLRLFDLCGYLNIDIEKHIIAKMRYNKSRSHKHNKAY